MPWLTKYKFNKYQNYYRLLCTVILCLFLLNNLIWAYPSQFDTLRPIAFANAHKASSAGQGQPALPGRIRFLIELEDGTKISRSFPYTSDFHTRILSFETLARWIQLRAAKDTNGFKLTLEGLTDTEAALEDFKTVWMIYGFEYDPAVAMPFRITPTQKRKSAEALIEKANKEKWGREEEAWVIGGKRAVRAKGLPKISSGEKPRVLLISSGARDEVIVTNRQEGRLIAPNFGLYRLKAYMENNGYAEADVFNPELYGSSEEVAWRVVSMMLERKYHIIGFSPTHSNLLDDFELAWLVKKVDAMMSDSNHPLFMVGGNEATNDAKNLLSYAPFDIAAVGFGEATLAYLAKAISQRDRRPLYDILSGMEKGVAYVDGAGRFIDKPPATLTAEEFIEYNYMNHPIIEMPYRTHWIHNALSITAPNLKVRRATLRCVRLFFTTRCAKAVPCGFCANCLVHEQSVLGLPAEQMADLVRMAVDAHRPEAIFINDDDVLMGGSQKGRKRFIEFCQRICQMKEEGIIPRELGFYLQTRSKSLIILNTETGSYEADSKTIAAMKEAGFMMVSIGIESFSDRVLQAPSIRKMTESEIRAIEEKGLTPSDIHKIAIDGLLKGGVTPQLNLVGLPPEANIEDLLTTMDTSIEYALKGAQLALTTYVWYLPGASLASEPGYEGISLQKEDRVIAGTNIAYPYYNRYVPLNPDVRAITRVGNIWRRADRIWDGFLAEPDIGPHLSFFRNPPLQFRVLTIFIAELELLAEYLGMSGRGKDAQDIRRKAGEVRRRTRDIIRLNLSIGSEQERPARRIIYQDPRVLYRMREAA